MDLITVPFYSFEKSVVEALDALNAHERIAGQSQVLIKPNLINDSPHPITTSAACCEVIINYVRNCSNAEITIAEGCGDSALETPEVFCRLGYDALADATGVHLVDLNTAPLIKMENPDCPVFPEMLLPEIIRSHYIISVPVLKAHSLAMITGNLKNMMGFAPPQHYGGGHGGWKKAVFHGSMQQSLLDLNRYVSPDLCVLDGSIGMAEYHLGGPHCNPPVKKIIAGYNAWEVDREAAGLLGLDWRKIAHINGWLTD